MTSLLQAAQAGDSEAPEELFPLIYHELRRVANRMLQDEPPGQTIQATALVHDAYLRLIGSDDQTWENRRHFFNAAARAMRRILIDRARRKRRVKHGGERVNTDIDVVEIPILREYQLEHAEAIDNALCKLAKRDPRACEIIHCRFFAGLTIQDTAELMDISQATVKSDWSFARSWLKREIEGAPHREVDRAP